VRCEGGRSSETARHVNPKFQSQPKKERPLAVGGGCRRLGRLRQLLPNHNLHCPLVLCSWPPPGQFLNRFPSDVFFVWLRERDCDISAMSAVQPVPAKRSFPPGAAQRAPPPDGPPTSADNEEEEETLPFEIIEKNQKLGLVRPFFAFLPTPLTWPRI